MGYYLKDRRTDGLADRRAENNIPARCLQGSGDINPGPAGPGYVLPLQIEQILIS